VLELYLGPSFYKSPNFIHRFCWRWYDDGFLIYHLFEHFDSTLCAICDIRSKFGYHFCGNVVVYFGDYDPMMDLGCPWGVLESLCCTIKKPFRPLLHLLDFGLYRSQTVKDSLPPFRSLYKFLRQHPCPIF
jgi:hypothetical protein